MSVFHRILSSALPSPSSHTITGDNLSYPSLQAHLDAHKMGALAIPSLCAGAVPWGPGYQAHILLSRFYDNNGNAMMVMIAISLIGHLLHAKHLICHLI